MKSFIKSVKVFVAVVVIATFGFYIWTSDKYTVPILMYHSVNVTQGAEGITVDPQSFANQMKFLKINGYNVISLDRLVSAIKRDEKLPRNSVVITFDDGNADNYEHAFPSLKENGFPAIIFVIANTVGHKGYVTWAQLKEMEKYGVIAGSHTLDHTYLPGAPTDVQYHQIAESKRIIEKNLGHPIGYIAYPSGGFTEDVKLMAEQAGYKGACTTNRGYSQFNKDIFEIKRIRLKSNEPDFEIWAKVSGYYNLFKSPRDPG